MARVRIRFAKLGKIRWTSHRDTARMWERAFRRAGLPLVWTNGFSPRPKVSFGLALPTGYESVSEYLDLELAAPQPPASAEVDIDALPAILSLALPPGVDVLAAAVIDDRGPSLQEEISSCSWRFAVAPADGTTPITEERLAAEVERVLAADSLVVTRKRKGADVTDDIRPSISSLHMAGTTGDGIWLECDLSSRPRSLRPSELVAAFGPGVEERLVRRLHQWIERDGARWEPLDLPRAATTAPHAVERAS
ncbi:MAG TPA: TIGR03936 family radical SAM-associated protein [Acidimicrobiales bacterium]|nr:TIGR03936 family radical SAM-associated protein [Acidimicrobiales bacterium]